MAKTVEQIIESVRRNLFEAKKIRYFKGTTTSAGAADGTTAIDSSISGYNDDFFNGARFRPRDNVQTLTTRGQVLITDFTGSTGTLTFEAAIAPDGVGDQVASGTTYEIFDEGIWSDIAIIEWINSEQDALMALLTAEALATVTKRSTTAGTAGVAPNPTDMIRPIAITVGDRVAGLLNPDEQTRFKDDAFLPATTERPLAIFINGVSPTDGLRYRPANNVTITWDYVPRLAEMTTTQDTELPDHYVSLLVLSVTATAFLASEDHNNHGLWKNLRDDRIKATNTLHAGKTKLEKSR